MSAVYLTSRTNQLLDHLVGEAASDGVVPGFSKMRCAVELGWGRNTIERHLATLAEASLIEHVVTHPGPGGSVLKVRAEDRAEDRAECAPKIAPSARRVRAEDRAECAPKIAPFGPRHKEQDLLQEVEPEEGRKGPDRALTSNPNRDWTDQDFPNLVAPLAVVCLRDPRLVALDRPGPVIAALRPFTRAQIAHAVDLVRRRAETGKCRSPFGFLRSRALAIDPVYFPPDLPAAAGDKWAEAF